MLTTTIHHVCLLSRWLIASCVLFIALQTVSPHGLAVEAIETTDQLALRQEHIADKYARLEALLLRMADVDAATHPRRASILRRAVAQCNDRHVRHQLDLLVRLLTSEDLDRAVDRQKNVRQEFHALLELLLKEDRSKRLQDEQSRMRDYIKEIERLLRRQRGLQARTEGGDSARKLADQQQQLSQRTGDLGRQMRENEEQTSADDGKTEPHDGDTSNEGDQPEEGGRHEDPAGEQDGQSEDGDQGKQPSSDTDPNREPSEQGDGEQGEGKNGSAPKDSENSPSGGEPGKNGEPQDGQNQQGKGEGQGGGQGQGQGGQSGDPQPPSQPFGPRQRVEEARRRMEAALEKLRNEERGEATEEQQQAQEELRKALAELEEILRQTREEEIERVLALLESRFRKMLQLQVKVYEQTQQLDKTPAPQRDFEFDIQAGKLSFEQRKIVVEADRALTLLQDEGSSVAFPEVVGQARDDMQQVVERLAASKAGAVTQGIEQDIIAALEEMIDALQREQKRRDEKQPPMPPPGGGSSPEQALVDMLAELRMIRSMENRIYERTKRYAGLLEDADDLAGQADDGGELSSAIRRLGERQRRVQQITRDIVLGKNR